MNNKISIVSRILLVLASALLVCSIFLPIWRIDLDAPQYPEGLRLLIYADKLGGNVDIINGLNHYIGMKTLHTKDFIEFSILVYIIAGYALFSLLTAIVGNKKLSYILLVAFVLFGAASMVDFWRWEYEYGHDLNPNAAIIVPGMAYQPPLIGFKQLLNFGAYSIPDIGGWMMLGSGVFMLLVVLMESKILARFVKNKKQVAAILFISTFMFSSCGSKKAEPIKLNTDNCDFCKMTISDLKFACEVVTDKGRIHKFDDTRCMTSFIEENAAKCKNASSYISDYLPPHLLILDKELTYITGGSINSPMGGNIAAFANKDSAQLYKYRFAAQSINFGPESTQNQ